MVGNCVAWIDLAHNLAEGRPRGVKLAAGAPRELRWLVIIFCKEFGRGKGLVDDEVSVPGVFHEPLVRRRVASKDQFHAGVFDDETDRPVTCVNRWNRAYADAVLVVKYLVDRLVVEFLHLDAARNRRDLEGTGLVIPVVGL